MHRTLLASLLLCAACSDAIPDVGPGPFRGPLLVPFVEEDAPVGDAEPANAAEEAPALAATPKETPIEEPAAVEPSPADAEEAPVAPVASTAPETAPPQPEPSPAQPVASDAEPVAAADADEEVLLLDFDRLSDFEYTAPTLAEIEAGTERPEQLPEDVLAFDGKVVEIEGYMIPIEVEAGKVKSFILSRTLSGCCFGDMPNIQEWVDVKMEEGTAADYIPYAPVLVIGRISVGELVDEFGITSLYRMTAESVEDPW